MQKKDDRGVSRVLMRVKVNARKRAALWATPWILQLNVNHLELIKTRRLWDGFMFVAKVKSLAA